jgi:predicted branched-subunit amino acid permease
VHDPAKVTVGQLDPALRRRVVRDALSIGVAVGAYGLSFGAIAVAAHLSVAQACVLSACAFTGASQFALVSVLGAGGGAVAGTSTALLLGSRNALYAVRLARLFQGPRRWQRPFAAHWTIDETAAMAVRHEEPAASRLAFWATGLTVFVFWNLATLVGALAASAIGDPKTVGFDAAFPAAFLALLAPRLPRRREQRTAVGAGVVAVLATTVLPAGVPVLLAGAVTVLVGLRP